MDRTKAQEVLELYGEPAMVSNTPTGERRVVIRFARQNMADVEAIEKMPDDDLTAEWKSLTYLNEIYGCVSMNDLERITLLEMEMALRKGIDKEALMAWYKEAEAKHNAEEEQQA